MLGLKKKIVEMDEINLFERNVIGCLQDNQSLALCGFILHEVLGLDFLARENFPKIRSWPKKRVAVFTTERDLIDGLVYVDRHIVAEMTAVQCTLSCVLALERVWSESKAPDEAVPARSDHRHLRLLVSAFLSVGTMVTRETFEEMVFALTTTLTSDQLWEEMLKSMLCIGPPQHRCLVADFMRSRSRCMVTIKAGEVAFYDTNNPVITSVNRADFKDRDAVDVFLEKAAVVDKDAFNKGTDEGGGAWGPKELGRFLALDKLLLVYKDPKTSEIVGILCGEMTDRNMGTACLIHNVAVKRSAQGRGIGTKLIHFALYAMYQEGIHCCGLEAVFDKVSFYTKLGFVACEGREKNRPRSATVTMTFYYFSSVCENNLPDAKYLGWTRKRSRQFVKDTRKRKRRRKDNTSKPTAR